MLTLGIDEAGRGSVIGPLIVAGVSIPEDKFEIMEKIGVKDSKRLTKSKRNFLYRKLTKSFEYHAINISAQDIDNLRAKNVNLNEIEVIAMIKIIESLNKDIIIIDSVDIDPIRLSDHIKSKISEDIEIISEHKADDKYIPVSAASIIAKVQRDLEIQRLDKKYKQLGGIGSGYPSDPKTKSFLTNFKYEEMPDFVRRSWSTIQNIKDNF